MRPTIIIVQPTHTHMKRTIGTDNIKKYYKDGDGTLIKFNTGNTLRVKETVEHFDKILKE